MISTILWDVDGTLLDFEYSQHCSLTKCLENANIPVSEELISRYSEINLSFWKRLELGEVSRKELYTGRFLKLFEEYGITDVDVNDFAAAYQKGLGMVYRYLDDSLKLCSKLHGQMMQYVITNGDVWTQKNKLKLSGLSDLMDGIFVSDEIGTPKPGKGFFDVCLGTIKEKDKSRILVVGDSLTSDIKGGVNAGLQTCWYRPEGTDNTSPWKPDYEISNLWQIEAVLREA